MISIKTATDSLFFSKNDAKDSRLGDLAQVTSPDELAKLARGGWAILGYPDDDGIRLNGGRLGARGAPDCIRKYFYRMTAPNSSQVFHDLGNLHFEVAPDSDSVIHLRERHTFAQKTVLQILSAGKKVMSLGGGHDYGFPDAAAFVEHNLKSSSLRPVVINFDAHLDVRPSDKGFHSGTPFHRLLEKYHGKIDFFEVGIQPQCNSVHHQAWAKEHGAVILDLMSLERQGMLASLQRHLPSSGQVRRPLWLSIDIDGFCSAEAPGCSQSFSTGLRIQEFLPALRHLSAHFDVQGLGVYEVSPALDQDDRTSKLAALILFHTVFPSL